MAENFNEFRKRLNKAVVQDPKEAIKSLEGGAGNAIEALKGVVYPDAKIPVEQPMGLPSRSPEDDLAFKLRQKAIEDKYASEYEKAGMPNVQEEMSPQEEALMRQKQLEMFMEQSKKGPRGL